MTSGLTTDPAALSAAASNLSSIGDSMAGGMQSAAGPTTAVVSPAMDPVSMSTAHQFVVHAQAFQTVGAQAQAVYQQLVATLQSNSTAYETAEAANTAAAG